MVASHPSRPSDAQVLDAIIIGGGLSGLSAALVLGPTAGSVAASRLQRLEKLY